MKHFSKSLVCLLLVLLLAAAALTGCAQNSNASTEAPKTEAQTEAPKTDAPKTEGQTEAPETEVQELGEGSSLFYLEVSFADGGTASYAIHTDAETVGAALTELELIEGENGMYTTVCGNTLDWDADHMYWAFYIDGDYASTGLDDTVISPEAHYALTATEG